MGKKSKNQIPPRVGDIFTGSAGSVLAPAWGETLSDERLGIMSASSMERYFACPGSRLLESAVARQAMRLKTNAAAIEGNIIHEANESGDISDLEISEADQVKLIRQREEELTRQWCEDHDLDIGTITIFREERFWLGNIATAKLDFLALSPNSEFALVSDAKSGRKRVTPPVKNWQLRTCVSCAHNTHRFKEARVAIANVWGRPDPPCDYSNEDILAIHNRLFALDKETRKLDARLHAGDHCEHCPAKHICPEVREKMPMILQVRQRVWSMVPPDQKKDTWLMSKVIRKACDDIDTLTKGDLRDDPDSIPGLGKRKDGETTKITDPLGAWLALRASDPNHIIKIEQFISECCSVSMEKLQAFFASYITPVPEDFQTWLKGKDFITKIPRSGAVYVKKEE